MREIYRKSRASSYIFVRRLRRRRRVRACLIVLRTSLPYMALLLRGTCYQGGGVARRKGKHQARVACTWGR